MKLFSNSIFNQSFSAYLVVIFLSLVLFNTTYMGLGTIVPIVVISFIIFYVLLSKHINNDIFKPFLFYAFFITLSTLVMGADFRGLVKIILLICVAYSFSLLKFTLYEVKFISFMLCVAYSFYAILVIKSIGMEWRDYGRVQIRILNGEIPLDPNVISATFILPAFISLYNLMYGTRKIIAGLILTVFIIALISTGSRGAFISLAVTSLIFMIKYVISNKGKQNIFIKLFVILVLFGVVSYSVFYISQQNDLTGLSRLLDYSDGSNGRTTIWKDKLSLLLESPICGYGVNNEVGVITRGRACHNTFLEVIFYGGFVGFFFFMIPFVRLFKRKTLPLYLKVILFLSVCLPVSAIDTLPERTLWNFLIFYELLSRLKNAEDGLLWNKQNYYINHNHF